MRKWIGLLLTAVFLAGCGGGAPSTSPAAPSQPAASGAPSGGAPAAKKTQAVSLAMAWIPIANQLPFYLALHRGYYKDNGLDAKIVGGKGSALTAQQVAAGQYDIGQTDLNVMALTRDKGAKVKAVMVQFPKTPFGLFVAKSTGITDWKQLLGKSVIVSPGSPENFLLPAAFKKLGLDYSKVQIVNTQAANKNPDYLTGKGDATGTDVAGYIPVIDPKRPSNHLWFGDVLNVPYLGLFAREDYIQAHPDIVKGVVAATVKATQDLANDPKAAGEAAKDMVDDNPGQNLDPKVFVDSWNIYKDFLNSPLTKGHVLGWQSDEAWKDTLQILHDYADLKGSMNPADYYTNAFLPQS